MRSEKIRTRCSDKKFLEAVYSSKTYAEISEKTGQKIPTTIARYNRLKKELMGQETELPAISRKKRTKLKKEDMEYIKVIVSELRDYYTGN